VNASGLLEKQLEKRNEFMDSYYPEILYMAVNLTFLEVKKPVDITTHAWQNFF